MRRRAVAVPDVLVTGAWEPELARVRERVANDGGLASRVILAPLGVGLVESAVGATRLLSSTPPRLALFVGTCGAFADRGFVIGDVVAATSVRFVDAGLLAGVAELPPPMPRAGDVDARMLAALTAAGARPAVVGATVGVTVDDAHAARIASALDVDVEHLEAFAFVRACAAASVPCALVLGVANPVGRAGRDAWREHHVSASDAAGELCARALTAIARL